MSKFLTRKYLMEQARLEVDQWHWPNKGVPIAILYAFIHRVVEGEPIFPDKETNATKSRKSS